MAYGDLLKSCEMKKGVHRFFFAFLFAFLEKFPILAWDQFFFVIVAFLVEFFFIFFL